MKVILSVDPIKYPLTGTGRYTYELAKELGQSNQIDCLRLYKGTRLIDSVPETAARQSNAVTDLSGRLHKSRILAELYRAIMPPLKARALRGLEDHLFHGTSFYLPPFGGRSAVTIHDLSPFSWAACHPPERVRYMQAEVALSLKRASVLITDSEFTRQEVAAHFGWPLEKVYAVSLASSKKFYQQSPSVLNPVLGRYGLSAGAYSLFAGTIEPRKNIDTLLNAYAMLSASVRKNWPLIFAGYHGWNSEALHARMANAERSGWARYLGFVPFDHLPVLFAGARLFVFPSLYEGFGLPVLEAMASGVPVVCSNSSSLPEVVGDAAAMCDAHDADSLNQLISIGLEDEEWRSNAVAKGLRRAERFSWRRCACETINVYKAVLNL